MNKNPVVYLPHHAEIKESSSTTKLKIVFDGSMKSHSELSLNDCLLVGPKRPLYLIDLLFKWSLHKTALVSDITKMYSKEDRDLLRFFWRENYNNPVKELLHTRHVFGTASAAHSSISAVQ
uniref:Putative LOC101744643 [Bombyx mori] n=1 Tax=Lepeophtheirus salmonis TaxID=72036 RepID=A0A0K2TDV5_LEPSM